MKLSRVPDQPNTVHDRKPYQKPVIEKVRLVAEEAVLGFCKTVGSSGPSGVGCGIPLNCSVHGS